MMIATAEEAATTRRREILRLADKVRLPFRSRAWRGSAGGWQGRNHGSSIDFQDHRAYAPGDDPRHLDWAAYARTNHYVMKLFREEVSPRLDLVLDTSASMALTPAKEARALDLFTLALTAARRDGISVRSFLAPSAGRWTRLEGEAAAALNALPAAAPSPAAKDELPLGEIPFRPASLRLLISDLLSAQAPEVTLAHLGRDQGRAVILAPYLEAEAEPDWRGNLDLRDCETARVRQQRVEPYLLERYHANYRRHFECWRQEARRRAVPLARIACELPLAEAVRRQALPAGALEARH